MVALPRARAGDALSVRPWNRLVEDYNRRLGVATPRSVDAGAEPGEQVSGGWSVTLRTVAINITDPDDPDSVVGEVSITYQTRIVDADGRVLYLEDAT